MNEKQKQEEMGNKKRNIISKELATDVLMVALLAAAIFLLALVL